ncbi:MAG: class I mannose-6-phosphate isomerase [Planctomycetota bacterium]|nr:class I mannose-6-phosphate isomerase [Planctomycetota bacterium]
MLADLPPLLLRPHYVQKPWGGRRLAEDLGREDLPDGPVGESWELFDLGGNGIDDELHCSRVEGGRFNGEPLRNVLGHPFPLLLKVIDASEHLSVQLHPDAASGGQVKEEAWVALADGGEVAVASPDVDLRGNLPSAGTWLKRLARVRLDAGAAERAQPPTMVHIPPGTVHAILAGTLLFEVQNRADVTWRLDDHGRVDAEGKSRALHVEQATEVLARGTPVPAPLEAGGRRLVTGHFTIDLHPPGTIKAPHAEVVFFPRGGFIQHGEHGTFDVPPGRTAWIPPTTTVLESEGWTIAAASL